MLSPISVLVYTGSETEQVVITQFGQAKRVVKEAGLHFKKPVVEKVNRFEKRILEWDGRPTQVPTRDKRYIWVDSFARWRIADPLKFFQRLSDERSAHDRLDGLINGAVRNQISNHLPIDAIRTSNRPMSVMVGIEGEEASNAATSEKGRKESVTRPPLIVAVHGAAHPGGCRAIITRKALRTTRSTAMVFA